MRYLGVVAIFVLAMSAAFSQGALVSAATLSASGDITITARVADTHYVIVNNQDEILEIISNTTRSAAIKVFRGSTNTNEIPLSKDVYDQYLKLTERHQGGIGTLYKKEHLAASSDKQSYLWPLQSNALSLIRYFR